MQGLRLVLGEKGGLAIEGSVIDSKGNPIAKAQISAYQLDGDNGSGHSDDRGQFRITGLDPGEYRLSAHASGYDSSQPNIPASAGSSGAQIILLATGTLTGRVVDDHTGEPIPEFELFYRKGDAESFGPGLLMNRREVRDPDGRFVRDGVYAGPATLTARAPGYTTGFTSVEALSGETISDVEIRIRPSEGLVGKVVDSTGQPVDGAQVFFEVIPDESWRKNQTFATTSSDGRFEIDSVPDGLKRLAAYHPGLAPGASDVSADTVIVLSEAARLEGRVTLGGAALQKPWVSVTELAERSISHSGQQPDSDGFYVFDGLPAGSLQVSARYDRGRSMSGFAQIESGSVTELDFPFALGSSIVEGRTAPPPEDSWGLWVNMRVATALGEEDFRTQAESVQGEWRYRFDEVPAGRAWLKAEVHEESRMTVAGYSREFEILDDAVHEVNLEELGASSLALRVHNLHDSERAHARLLKGEFVFPSAYDQMVAQQNYPFQVGSVRLDSAGAGEFTGLYPGTYTVVVLVSPEGGERDNSLWRWSSGIVEVGKDEQASLDIRHR
jgi:hypothetical protein